VTNELFTPKDQSRSCPRLSIVSSSRRDFIATLYPRLLAFQTVIREIVQRVARITVARRAVQVLQLHRLANYWLSRFPLIKKLPTSGVVYRASRLESIPLALEMFDQEVLYNPSIIPESLSTFVDLGCNVGYFTCWLAHHRGRALKGIMVDANPAAIVEAKWHVTVNGLQDVDPIHGIAGEKSDAVDFYLYDSNICSSSAPPDSTTMSLTGKWTKITVPSVRIGKIWRSRFDATPCDLLKIDIEGSELQFVQQEADFLKIVKTVVVEWHSWRATKEALISELEQQGFRLVKILDESATMGTALLSRQ
jgi:FkbM family methyltransferase